MTPNLVLIGFMATGKSTIGRRCAAELGFRFRDSDTLIERRTGRSIATLFAEEGEETFRTIEAQAIRDLARGSRVVIATGGGVPLNTSSIAALRRTGVVALLWASVDVLLDRTRYNTRRPLLAGDGDPRARIESLLANREPYYRSAAHITIETSNVSCEGVVERVLEAYRAHVTHHCLPGETHRRSR